MPKGYIPLTETSFTPYGSLPTDAQAQNAKSARVYVFGDDDVCQVSDDEDHIKLFEVRPRGRKSGEKQQSKEKDNIIYLEREVTKEDSLQSISIQYKCQVSEIKRVNNLIQDIDFYARKTIKVPIPRYSLLSEHLNLDQKSGNVVTSTNHSSVSPDTTDQELVSLGDGIRPRKPSENSTRDEPSEQSNLDSTTLIRTISIGDLCRAPASPESFLRQMDKDLEKIRMSQNSIKSSLDEVVSDLTETRFYPMEVESRKSFTECGISWWAIVIIGVVIIGLVVPLAYFLYFENGGGKNMDVGR